MKIKTITNFVLEGALDASAASIMPFQAALDKYPKMPVATAIYTHVLTLYSEKVILPTITATSEALAATELEITSAKQDIENIRAMSLDQKLTLLKAELECNRNMITECSAEYQRTIDTMTALKQMQGVTVKAAQGTVLSELSTILTGVASQIIDVRSSAAAHTNQLAEALMSDAMTTEQALAASQHKLQLAVARLEGLETGKARYQLDMEQLQQKLAECTYSISLL